MIVDKLDLIRGDGRAILHEKKAKAERLLRHRQRRTEGGVGVAMKSEAAARLEKRAALAVERAKETKMQDHCRTHLRRGLTEERARELRRLLLLPKLTHDHIGNISCGAQAAV